MKFSWNACLEMIRKKNNSQIAYWTNGSAEAEKLSGALATEKWDARCDIVKTADEFSELLDTPRLNIVAVHTPELTQELTQRLKTEHPDVLLLILTDDEKSIPNDLREYAHHIINARQLNDVMPLFRRALNRSKRFWAMADERDTACKQAAMLNEITEAVILQRPDGSISMWNQAAEQLFGWSVAEALSRKHGEVLALANGTKPESITAGLKLNGSWSGDVHYIGKDKRDAYVRSRKTWLDGDETNGTLEICTDRSAEVQELRKTQLVTNVHALFASSLPLQDCLEQFAHLVVPLLADACVVDVIDDGDLIRRAAVAATDPKLKNLVPALREEIPVFPSNRRTVLEALRSPQPISVDTINDLADFLGVSDSALKSELRGVTPFSALAAPISDAKAVGLLTLLYAKGTRTLLEADKQRLMQFGATVGLAIEKARLKRQVNAPKPKSDSALYYKDAFLGTVSHELRTPLQAMFGWTQLMRDKKLTENETEKALDALELSLGAQNKIVNDLLDLSRINSGNLALSPRAMELQPLVERTMDEFAVAAGIKQIDMQLTDESHAPLLVMADAMWLQRAFRNLISNAIKFTPIGGRVTIRIAADALFATVEIADTGVGIEAHFLPHVFEHFTQSDVSTTRAHYGLGIGLAIALNVVESHGGNIAVTSAGKDQGATFTVTIPLCASVDVSNESSVNFAVDAQGSVTLDGVRVLLVEDENDTAALLSFVLEQAGAKVTQASSVRDGLSALNTQKFDMLVSDIGMPQEDGISFIKKVRATPGEKGYRLPALALTAYASKEDRMQALRAGFDMHVPKPVDISEFLLIVSSLAHRAKR